MLEVWLRYDFMNRGDVSNSELYSTALDQLQYADENGVPLVKLSEHHNTAFGYLPSPILFAGAIAVRTKRMRFQPRVLMPLLDPLRVAEDTLVVDTLSNGRIELNVLLGYRDSEFSMFGTSRPDRVRRVEDALRVLKAAFTQETFSCRGQQVSIHPRPVQPGGPPIFLGGGVPAAARRAARMADGFVPANTRYALNEGKSMPDLIELYKAECRALGHEPGRIVIDDGPAAVWITEDPERTWDILMPYLQFDQNAYISWMSETSDEHGTGATAPAVLKQSGHFRVVTPDEAIGLAKEIEAAGHVLMLAPLLAGAPAALGWETLELFVNRVRPNFDLVTFGS